MFAQVSPKREDLTGQRPLAILKAPEQSQTKIRFLIFDEEGFTQ
jgi:hypothetical protein